MNDTNMAPGLTAHRQAAANLPAPPRVTTLASTEAFQQLAQRQTQRSWRHGQAMAALQLWPAPDPALGDQLLGDWRVECTRRLCSRVRSTDSVACWPDHHHGVLLMGCRQAHADAVLQRLIAALSQPYGRGDRLLFLRWQGARLDLAVG